MPVRRPTSSGWSLVAAPLSWRGVPQRFSFALFIGLSFFLLILSRTHQDAVSSFRAHSLDMLAPILDVVARPALAVEKAGDYLHDFIRLRSDNRALREENTHMIEWQNAVVSLEKENRELRTLLKFKTEPRVSYISARAIADTGGAYSRGLIITAGKEDGVREGMAAITGEGLIGRVIEAGSWSSRVWLISDPNSRIPVTIAETGDRAILAGDNTTQPKLLFLARNASVPDGARVVTSGHGGVFPPNLPIGILREADGGVFTVIPTADLGRITYVRLVDFNLEGGVFNPIGIKKPRAESKK
jgi:rod shape-determining protein MreC